MSLPKKVSLVKPNPGLEWCHSWSRLSWSTGWMHERMDEGKVIFCIWNTTGTKKKMNSVWTGIQKCTREADHPLKEMSLRWVLLLSFFLCGIPIAIPYFTLSEGFAFKDLTHSHLYSDKSRLVWVYNWIIYCFYPCWSPMTLQRVTTFSKNVSLVSKYIFQDSTTLLHSSIFSSTLFYHMEVKPTDCFCGKAFCIQK